MSRKVSTIFTHRLLIYLSVAIALAATGCSIFKSEMENDLDAARALWEDEGFANYSMRYGYGGATGALAATVHVEGGIVVAFEDVTAVEGTLSDSAIVARNISVSNFGSVEGLFGIIASAIDRDADVINATYHAKMGYPESVFIDYSETYTDNEISYGVSDVLESQ